ncbi:unnamed protein product [Eruca vesicaria subsp. sativa]|uniref:Uncharacterized protein n=1 Tax=Eruca vesicaria subsp. sativa TaxID=29727 RepID=A0ABC8JG67_ERUVS|nr:unnamed protein product [Eruca vesicaria subsp. sativa]
MAIKRLRITVEITTDRCETTERVTRSKSRKKLTKEVEKKKEEEDETTPLRGIFCLKQRQDMKIVEEKEDCFILDFDPNDSFDSGKLSSSSDSPESDDDVAIIHEKGQVACRDFPHPRHLCLKYPFKSTNHQLHCNNCYCYVCDVPAPCPFWTPVNYESHCEAVEETRWKHLRALHARKKRISHLVS